MNERKREKEDDKLARDRVKAQIEADKQARKKVFDHLYELDQRKLVTSIDICPQKPPKDYTETKLQVLILNILLP